VLAAILFERRLNKLAEGSPWTGGIEGART